MERFIQVAKIVKARKKQGRLVVRSVDGLPFLLQQGMTVHIVPPSLDVLRTVRIEEVWEGVDEFTVAFEGVVDYGDLCEYVGRFCLVARDDIDSSLFAATPQALTGCTVQDVNCGDLGQVTDVWKNPYQTTLVVNGSAGEVLIPLVDEFVVSRDEGTGLITVDLPEGLIDPEACETADDEAAAAQADTPETGDESQESGDNRC